LDSASDFRYYSIDETTILRYVWKRVYNQAQLDGTGTYFYPHYPTEIAGVASAIAAHPTLSIYSPILTSAQLKSMSILSPVS